MTYVHPRSRDVVLGGTFDPRRTGTRARPGRGRRPSWPAAWRWCRPGRRAVLGHGSAAARCAEEAAGWPRRIDVRSGLGGQGQVGDVRRRAQRGVACRRRRGRRRALCGRRRARSVATRGSSAHRAQPDRWPRTGAPAQVGTAPRSGPRWRRPRPGRAPGSGTPRVEGSARHDVAADAGARRSCRGCLVAHRHVQARVGHEHRLPGVPRRGFFVAVSEARRRAPVAFDHHRRLVEGLARALRTRRRTDPPAGRGELICAARPGRRPSRRRGGDRSSRERAGAPEPASRRRARPAPPGQRVRRPGAAASRVRRRPAGHARGLLAANSASAARRPPEHPAVLAVCVGYRDGRGHRGDRPQHVARLENGHPGARCPQPDRRGQPDDAAAHHRQRRSSHHLRPRSCAGPGRRIQYASPRTDHKQR